MRKILLIFAVMIVSAMLLVQLVSAQNGIVLAEAQRISGDRFTVTAKTRNGANVVALKQPSAQVLEAIDTGLTQLFAVARKNGYKKKLNYSDYTIYIAKADRTKDISNNYSPDVAVSAGQYAGSIYDKGGYIYAAGIVVAYNPRAFMIAEHTKNFERISEAVRNEGEHLVLYQNDRQRYQETADHSKGGGHPILQ